MLDAIVAAMTPADRDAYDRLARLMSDQLGGEHWFQAWLASPHPSYHHCPLDAIRNGLVRAVLEAQQAQYGPGYTPA